MKKLIALIVLVMLVSPAFTQKGKAGKGIVDAAHGARALKETAELGQAVKKLIQVPGTQMAAFINIPGKPRVLIEMPEAEPPKQPKLLSAQVLNGDEFRQGVFPQNRFRHLPTSLNSGMPALYRGMGLRLKEVENILRNGVQKEKSSFDRLYFSTDIDIAVSCADEENLSLPVIVKVGVTPELEKQHPFSHDADNNYTFLRDIPAEFVTNVFTYIKVNGKRDWYEMVLKDGQLTLKPTLTQDYRKGDLIIHKFGPQSFDPTSFFTWSW